MCSGRGQVFEAFEKANDVNALPDEVIKSVDAVIVLGGGVPFSLDEPPLHTQRRCDVAAAIVEKHRKFVVGGGQALPIVALSAGTAHLPQFLSSDGLPVWEATSSAAYLSKKYGLEDNVYVETSSYDTISNAFFCRTTHTDVVGWRKLAVITNEFQIARTQSIFDWIFHLDAPEQPYELHYVACDNVGLSEEALQARREHEAKGDKNVRENLVSRHTSMKDVWHFLHHEHDFYTAARLANRARKPAMQSTAALKKSYGASENSRIDK